MASQGKGRRDSDDTTVVSGSAAVDGPGNWKSIEKRSGYNQRKKRDPEAGVTIYEKSSISDSTIKVKQLSWQEAAGLMFTEYIVIAILSFPSSYSVLGMAGGVLTTIILGFVTLYTSHVLWRFCMRHPGATDICDLSSRLFPPWFRKTAYYLTAAAFLLNNLFIMGLHVLSGSVALNTLSQHSLCTLAFTGIMAAMMFALSLARSLNQVAKLGFLAASTMFLALLLWLIFLGVQGHPKGWNEDSSVTVRAWAVPGTTFTAGFNAFLNINYTYVGQILIPTYVEDMRRPQDFPKALYLCTALEIVLFTIGGSIGYYLIGDQNMVSPAYGALIEPYVKAVAAFTMPTLVIVGVLYANITSRFIFSFVFDGDSKHRLQNTMRGWSVWLAIVFGVWIAAWVIGAGIPFFNDLLSLMSSLFDWYFGFVMEGLAFFAIYNRAIRWSAPLRRAETLLNVVIIVAGIFTLGGGAYSSINAIRMEYADGTVAGAFTCENNGF